MFGYTLPQYNKMSSSDLGIYQRYYCETCHQLKDNFGLVSTAAVNYDMTFNTIIINAVAGDVQEFDGTKHSMFCVFQDPKADSDIMRKMAGYTILLTKWELVDDAVDKPSMKTNFIDLVLGRAISKAEKLYPEYDRIVGNGFEELRKLESDKCTDVIRIGNTFGRSLSVALSDFAGERSSGELEELFVQLTTLVYILDAIDDLDEDYMNGTYNPYLVNCEYFVNKKDYIAKNIYSLTETVNSVVGSMQKAYNGVKKDMRSCVGVADNIVYYGLPESAKNVLSGTSGAKASVKNTLKGHKERNASK
jgi:hypothetical protein